MVIVTTREGRSYRLCTSPGGMIPAIARQHVQVRAYLRGLRAQILYTIHIALVNSFILTRDSDRAK